MDTTSDTLVVDLDGTLLKSDMFHESFWSACSENWRIPFLSVLALIRGKAAIKSFLCSKANINAASLPYREEIFAYICSHREKGGRTALVTASNQAFADAIAKHLQLFDDVHGSNDYNNLKGANKAEFLNELYGQDSFLYIGDSHADLPIWRDSKRIITVNVSLSLQQKTEKLGKPTEHLVTTKTSKTHYLKALRPHQWLKNILTFLPMVAAHKLDSETFILSLLAFIAFSLVASSVYVLNDLLDLKADRAHPRKCLRPFACGAIPIQHGSLLALGLLIGGFLVAAFLGWKFLIVLGAYYALTTAYSLTLKSKIVLDICILAGLYATRIVAGGSATEIELSVWLLAFSIFFFFSLAAIKRQTELVDMAERNVSTQFGRGYQVKDLPIISTIGLTAGYLSVLVMALYVNSPAVKELYAFPYALWGICFVLLYWLTRMVFITHRGSMDDDPVFFAAKDRVSQVCFVLMLSLVVIGALL